MIYYLLALLLLLLASALILTSGDILSPWVISIGMILISCFFAALYAKKWDAQIGAYSIALIITALLLFGLGELLIVFLNELYYKNSKQLEDSYNKSTLQAISIPVTVTYFVSAVLFVCLLYYGIRIYRISVEGGNTQGISQMLYYARLVLITPGNHIGRLGNHMMFFARAAAQIYLLAVMNQIVLKRYDHSLLLYMCPIILYFMFGILSTGRTFIIELFAAGLIYYFIMDSKFRGWKKQSILKVVLLGIIALVAFFVLFSILGIMKGWSAQGIIDKIAFYTGLSIPSFDYFAHTYKNDSMILGEETLYGLHDILRRLGIFIPQQVRHLEFAYFTGVRGNVYLSFRRYMHDYGIGGLFLIQFFLGMLYESVYIFLKRTKHFYPTLIIYGFLFYPLIMQGIDELLFSSMITTSTIYLAVYVGILYYFCIYREEHAKLKQIE